MRRRFLETRGIAFATAIAATLTTAIGPAVASAVSPVSDHEVQLQSNVPAGLSRATRVADEDSGRAIDVQFSLHLRNSLRLDDLIRRVSTPGSPEYGRYLTPPQFRAQFGPSAADVTQAVAFLQAGGLTVTAASPGSTLIDATATVAVVERALHTSIGRYREETGQEFFANDAAPTIPASLASTIVGVVGLDNRHQLHRSALQPRVCPPTCGSIPYTPNQIRTAYHLSAAPLTALTGGGQTLGLFELDNFRQANVDGFNTQFGLPALVPLRQVVAGGPTMTNGGEAEVELDIELMHAIAPGAQIMVFEGPNSPQSDVGTNDTYKCMVDPAANAACPNHASLLTAASNSTSWGSCEPSQAPTETTTLAAIFAQASAQGQSFFAASGDNGAHDCTSPNATAADPALAVDSPASDPNVTGAGGTNLRLNTDGSINLEVGWSNHPNAWNGSGGGTSIFFNRPSWQVGPGVDTSPGARRQVPDVALDADPNTGYAIYTCNSSAPCTGAGAGLVAVGGTSAAAPAWAGFAAIYNQYAASQSKPALGFANPTLYQTGACPQSFQPFNDVTAGDNRAGTATGYSAGPNYDMVTGMGSLRASDLALDILGPMPVSPLIQAIMPASGGTAGGTPVTLTGCRFNTSSKVMIDGVNPAVAEQVLSPNVIQATLPAHVSGQAAITVVNPGLSTSNIVAFTYVPPVLVAAQGLDGSLWMRRDRGSWTPLNGMLLGSPAVVSVPNGTVGSALYLGVGLDHDLWGRTDSTGWRPLDDLPVYCIDNPGAAVVGSTLYVGCMGGNRALYSASGPVSPGVVPSLVRSNWQYLGGILSAGPALAPVPGQGLDIMVPGTDGRVYEYHSGAFQATAFVCTGHPALAANPAATMTYFGCHAQGDGSLIWAKNGGGGWSAAASLGGVLVDGPAIAATNQGPIFYVEGLNTALYERGLSGGYSSDGGLIRMGTGAAALF